MFLKRRCRKIRKMLADCSGDEGTRQIMDTKGTERMAQHLIKANPSSAFPKNEAGDRRLAEMVAVLVHEAVRRALVRNGAHLPYESNKLIFTRRN